ncbi:amidase domain-containing protein [Streptomyces hesseae]|uniref:Amidase domain-containing protein n=1 Tax=Streptomyces hesseae TaxID=3075519 RepID=A0ABU2SNI5_9ACTN|nr:amidase domain-containing protein [Streptomyces sp. DSM 40473]MDT0450534.1 amidase domain-containing protein [Streptomyces sp. DSM 40473]
MVSYHDLYSCRVEQWKKAADDWVALSRRSESAAEDIRAQGKKPLDEHWADATGKKAGKRLEDIANRLEAGGDITKGVAMVLDGLAYSMEWAQRTLFHATELANEYGLRIQDGRAVGAYTGAAPTGPNVPQDVRDAYAKESAHISEIDGLIEESLRQAAQADEKASAELAKLAKAVDVANTSKAHNELEVDASHVEFDILRGSIPVGKDSHLVRAWWDGLTSEQQKALMRADPVTLADLKGLPPGVGQELRGADGKIDRVEMVRYALDHWDKKDDLAFKNNCANFVSSALEAGGMQRKFGSWAGPMGDNTWGRESGIGVPYLDQRAYHSRSWALAKELQKFLVRNGGEEVPRSEARPGDIIFYEQVAPGAGEPQGETYHAALVTSVSPDGDIKLSQHTSSWQNVSLDSRVHIATRNDGEQRIRFVRPHPNWY